MPTYEAREDTDGRFFGWLFPPENPLRCFVICYKANGDLAYIVGHCATMEEANKNVERLNRQPRTIGGRPWRDPPL